MTIRCGTTPFRLCPWPLDLPFQYSDMAQLQLSLLRTPHSLLMFKDADDVEMEDMPPAYWEAELFPGDCTLELDNECGDTTRIAFTSKSTVRDLVSEIHAYYHAPAAPELIERVKDNEFFCPEDENAVCVCDLMRGLVTSYGLQKVSHGVYKLDLHMY